MKKKHVTRDGVEMPIASMADDHLYNTLRMFLARVKQLRETASLPVSQVSEFDRVVYGLSDVSPAEAGRKVSEIVDHLAPYLLEGMLRPTMAADVALMFQRAMGRTEGDFPGTVALPVYTSDQQLED